MRGDRFSGMGATVNATPSSIVILLAATSFAGCLVDDASNRIQSDRTSTDLPNLTVGVEATKCVQAGGNSVYAMEEGKTKVGPFLAADQRAEIGDPVIGAFGRPVMGPQNGIWHSAVNCASYSYNGTMRPAFRMGWIGQMIKKPEFDDSDARLHFFIADLSFDNADFANWVRDLTKGAEVSPNTECKIDIFPGAKFMHVTISETRHGTFDFTAELHKEFGKKQTEHIRFWMVVARDGSHQHEGNAGPAGFYPVAIDVFDTADGTGKRLAGESIGTFTHLPDGHYCNPLGHVQDGFSRRVVLGPVRTDVMLNETWLH